MAERTIKVRGALLERLRNHLALTQRELGDRIGLSERRVSQIEREDSAGVYPKAVRKLAAVAGMGEDKMLAMLTGRSVEDRQKDFEAGMRASMNIASASKADDLKREERKNGGHAVELDRSFEPYSEVKVTDVPLFEASLAAGPWVDVSDIGEVCDPRVIDHGMFRVRLAGDSMQPQYADGSIVEFRCLRVDRDGVIEGRDYYVQREDGTATFKRVAKVTPETFELRALNKKKYPKPMMVERVMVVRMALAVAKVELLG